MVEERTDKRGKNNSNEFYTAIMDEDVNRIEGMLKKYGSQFLMQIKDGVSRGGSWQGLDSLPLHVAAFYRRPHSMYSLLSAGVDAQIKDHFGRTPLHLLIKNWPNSQTAWFQLDSRFLSALAGALKHAESCLQLLCEHGANVNAQLDEKSHQTPVHVSVHHGALSAVQMLISYGADVNAVDSSGMTPLHIAAGILHKDIITSLIKQGAEINMTMQHSGNTPLHLAAVAFMTKTTSSQDGVSCISILLNHGANPNTLNKAGMSALHQACSMANEDVVDLLLRYGADVNHLSKAGENCLFLFLNHTPNVRNSSLLLKLLSLTAPLMVFNQSGCLPSTLTQPCFFKQRDQLFQLILHPRTLQSICKSSIYLKHVRGGKEGLRKVLPKILFDFVFNHWDFQHISFVEDIEPDLIN